MATVEYEICSFLSKFRQLCDFGLNANLSFNNSSGNISVSLQVDIGNIRQHSKKKGGSHSRSRRRKRRIDASTEDMTYEPASAVNESQTTYESDQPIANSESENDLTRPLTSTSSDNLHSLENVQSVSNIDKESENSLTFQLEFGDDGIKELL